MVKVVKPCYAIKCMMQGEGHMGLKGTRREFEDVLWSCLKAVRFMAR